MANFRKMRDAINEREREKRSNGGFHSPLIEVREIEGNKGEGDRIIQLNTYGLWRNMSLEVLLEILDKWFKNEDRIYSEGRGGTYLLSAIMELREGSTVKEVLEKYGKNRGVYPKTYRP